MTRNVICVIKSALVHDLKLKTTCAHKVTEFRKRQDKLYILPKIHLHASGLYQNHKIMNEAIASYSGTPGAHKLTTNHCVNRPTLLENVLVTINFSLIACN